MKPFLVYNTSYFGDTILTDALCRNLKRLYPESRLVFVSNKPFTDISRYMDGVDEVWTYDKWGVHKGFAGWYKFYKEHKNQYIFRRKKNIRRQSACDCPPAPLQRKN